MVKIAGKLFSRVEFVGNFEPLTEEGRQAMVCETLRGKRHLLILDNMESNPLQEDELEEIHQFIAELDGGKTPVLVSSRNSEEWAVSFGENVYEIPGAEQEMPGEISQSPETDGANSENVISAKPSSAPQDNEAKKKTENLDTRILKILLAYYQKHPGEPRMMYNELVINSGAEAGDVIQCLYGLREKKWAKFDLAEGAETGLVWLTQVGIRIAGDIH